MRKAVVAFFACSASMIGAAPIAAQGVCKGKVAVTGIYALQNDSDTEYSYAIQNLTGKNLTTTIRFKQMPADVQVASPAMPVVLGPKEILHIKFALGKKGSSLGPGNVRYLYDTDGAGNGPALVASDCKY